MALKPLLDSARMNSQVNFQFLPGIIEGVKIRAISEPRLKIRPNNENIADLASSENLSWESSILHRRQRLSIRMLKIQWIFFTERSD